MGQVIMNYDLSVIIPAYNCEKILPETLDCLLGQSLHNIQIIVVNDGSSDGTLSVIKNYRAENGSIKIIDKQNGGVSSARNAGIEAAEGRYIIFLDADDLLTQKSAENAVKIMDERNADLGIFRLSRFGFGGNEYNPVVEEIVKEKNIDIFDNRLLYCFLIGNKIFKTSALKTANIKFPNTRYSEDGAFIMLFITKAKPVITGIDSAECKYRRSDPREIKTVTRSVTKSLIEDFEKSAEIIENSILESFEKPDCICKNKDDFLLEFYCKICITVINEFLRQVWNCDDEAVEELKKVFDKYENKLNGNYREKLKKTYEDLGKPVFSKKELAKKPVISVICKNPGESFLKTLYFQAMPCFELITEKAKMFKDKENISKSAQAKFTVKFTGKKELDPRFLKWMVLIKKKAGFLPSFAIKHITFILLKIKGC